MFLRILIKIFKLKKTNKNKNFSFIITTAHHPTTTSPR